MGSFSPKRRWRGGHRCLRLSRRATSHRRISPRRIPVKNWGVTGRNWDRRGQSSPGAAAGAVAIPPVRGIGSGAAPAVPRAPSRVAAAAAAGARVPAAVGAAVAAGAVVAAASVRAGAGAGAGRRGGGRGGGGGRGASPGRDTRDELLAHGRSEEGLGPPLPQAPGGAARQEHSRTLRQPVGAGG